MKLEDLLCFTQHCLREEKMRSLVSNKMKTDVTSATIYSLEWELPASQYLATLR